MVRRRPSIGSCTAARLRRDIASSVTTAMSPLPVARWAPLLAYNGGRVFSYTVAGLLLGLLAQSLLSAAQEMQLVLRLLAGLLLIISGLAIAGYSRWSAALERMGFSLWRTLSQRLSSLPGRSWVGRGSPWAMGMLWGWLPCGLVYSTLLWASAHSGSAAETALLMVAFGVGTLPAMLATGVMATQLQQLFTSRPMRLAAGLGIVLYGLWTIAGASMMAGHGGAHEHPHHHPHSAALPGDCRLIEPDQSMPASIDLHCQQLFPGAAQPTEVTV